MPFPDRVRLSAALRAIAWASVILIAYLSLVPEDVEIRTGLPGQFEHILAYAGATVFLTLAYPRRIARIGLGLIPYACLLEYLQVYIPGRHSQLIDVVASSAGVVIGIGIGVAAIRLFWQGRPPDGDRTAGERSACRAR